MSGFSNRPKILRGAFVEYGLSLPPLAVVFQFNPVELSRSRSLSFKAPASAESGEDESVSLRDFHRREEYSDLNRLRDDQLVSVEEETLSFDIRLDATDKLNDGDRIAGQFGIAPQLATLELMTYPKEESLLGQTVGKLLGSRGGFSFTKKENPPLILFIWGRKRVLPVNINSMNITETEFGTNLNPTRATVSVNLTVIEGQSRFYLNSKARQEQMSALNLANIADIADVVIPG